jgi:hypothetical protein
MSPVVRAVMIAPVGRRIRGMAGKASNGKDVSPG